MKVHIGPYLNYFGPYQLAEKLKYLGFSEDTQHKVGEILYDTWVEKVLHKMDQKFKHRKMDVTIDKYDIWSMDSTLAHIIVPMLKQLKESTHGAPNVDDEDVSESLQATSDPPTEEEGVDDNHFKRWDYVLDEMIWSFSQINEEGENQYRTNYGAAPFRKHQERMNNGFKLFGKYYQDLWD